MSYRFFSKWITCPRPQSDATWRLFCLPCAGAGASIYRGWSAQLPSTIEVCPIQLPGREDRYRETAFTSVTGLSRALSCELMPYLDRPFAIFGHSYGALLALEVARSLRQTEALPPRALFLAAYRAPRDAMARRAIHHLPDPEFIDEMRRLQGTPAAVLENRDLMAFVLPILRADFAACDTYRHDSAAPLACPLFMFGGHDDPDVAEQDLERWREQTSGSFSVEMMPGTHFFVESQRDRLLSAIGAHLGRLL